MLTRTTKWYDTSHNFLKHASPVANEDNQSRDSDLDKNHLKQFATVCNDLILEYVLAGGHKTDVSNIFVDIMMTTQRQTSCSPL